MVQPWFETHDVRTGVMKAARVLVWNLLWRYLTTRCRFWIIPLTVHGATDG